uniref:DDE-1 domain-containing protein n=1 Tax=Phytophthora ramorum TaxID=164328 RepID=H3H5X2_PHYRM
MPRRKQNGYTVKEKQGLRRRQVFTWNKQAESLLDFRGPKTSKTLKGQGRKEIFPSVSAVVTFMKDVRRDEKGFSSQKPQGAKKSLEELQMVRAEFALSFWSRYTEYQSGGILNVDEIGINFDMPPLRAWALKGRKDPAHIIGLKKHTGRMTAVLTTRTHGAKLPILFIVRGKPGGRIEKKEIPKYPDDHFYIV